jgi:uncharacterized protein
MHAPQHDCEHDHEHGHQHEPGVICEITPLTAADLVELRDFLDRRCLPQTGVNLPILDGLFAAMHTAPLYAHSAHWDEAIYGMTQKEAETHFFSSAEEAEHVDDLLWGRFHDVDQAFEKNRIEETFFSKQESDVESWCVGYLWGVLLHEQEWEPLLNPAWEISLQPEIAEAVALLRAYVTAHSGSVPALETFRDDPLRPQLLAVLPGAARHLFSYWRAYERARMPKIRMAAEQALPLRVAPKPGRNEPCPCSSGKKYKKCCGS